MTKGIKILFEGITDGSKRARVFVQMPNGKPKFLFVKDPEYAVRRRSKWSFVYRDKLYDFKSNLIRDWPLNKEG